MVVQQEGASPVVVGRYCERRLAVAGDRVDAGALCPLKAGVFSGGTGCRSTRSLRLTARRNVRQRVSSGRGVPPILLPGRRVGVGHYQNGRRIHYVGELAPDVRPPSHVWLTANVDLGGVGRQHVTFPAPG